MKCPRCGGNGSVPYPIDYEQGLFDETNCPLCGGSGEVITEQKYIQTCNTEQLAEFIIKAMLFYDNAGITVLDAIKNAVEDNEKLSKYFIENVVAWLKQPHTIKE